MILWFCGQISVRQEHRKQQGLKLTPWPQQLSQARPSAAYIPAWLCVVGEFRTTDCTDTLKKYRKSRKHCSFLLHFAPQLRGYNTWPLAKESWALSAPCAKQQAEKSGEDCEKGMGSLSLSGEDGSSVCRSLFHRYLRTKVLKNLLGKGA